MITQSQSNAPWVVVAPASATDLIWRCTQIEHLAPEINAGRHNIFIWLKINDQTIYTGPAIQYGWEGQRVDEKQKPKQLDKKPPEYSTDIAIELGMSVWLYVADSGGYASDRVSNLNALMPSDGAGNEWHHHSYNLTFALVPGVAIDPPVTPPDLAHFTLVMEEVKAALRGFIQATQDLQAAVDKFVV